MEWGIDRVEVRVLRDGPRTIGGMAARALRRITGEAFEYDEAGSEADRRAAIDAWRAWYQAQRGMP